MGDFQGSLFSLPVGLRLLVLLLLSLDDAFRDCLGNGFHTRLDVLAHVVHDVLRHWGRFSSYVALEGARVAEHAHDHADEQQWHANEGTPEEPGRLEAAEGREEAAEGRRS